MKFGLDWIWIGFRFELGFEFRSHMLWIWIELGLEWIGWDWFRIGLDSNSMDLIRLVCIGICVGSDLNLDVDLDLELHLDCASIGFELDLDKFGF